ncbi:MAG: VWA domain-containing protein [Gammaproteobacteria bacterium]|nr:VWA domain-containing protein [Gammaproteobacteria bacterium]
MLVLATTLLPGCSKHNPNRDQGIYMLLDASGTYAKELGGSVKIINHILSKLQPGDTFAVQRVDSGSFSEKNIIYSKTFDMRPSKANEQRLLFKQKIQEFTQNVKPSAYTDITGGILQGIEFLTEAGPGKKTILIFSDMKEELHKGYNRDIALKLAGFNVIAINITKLRSDNVNPQDYLDRLEAWKRKVEAAGGSWKTINDLDRLEPIFD